MIAWNTHLFDTNVCWFWFRKINKHAHAPAQAHAHTHPHTRTHTLTHATAMSNNPHATPNHGIAPRQRKFPASPRDRGLQSRRAPLPRTIAAPHCHAPRLPYWNTGKLAGAVYCTSRRVVLCPTVEIGFKTRLRLYTHPGALSPQHSGGGAHRGRGPRGARRRGAESGDAAASRVFSGPWSVHRGPVGRFLLLYVYVRCVCARR